MTCHQTRPARRSMRLNGFDYSEPGEYFITICARDRACIFGEAVGGRILLSDVGHAVAACWREIPVHFPDSRLGIFIVMPNHFHGIVEIVAKARNISQNSCRRPSKK